MSSEPTKKWRSLQSILAMEEDQQKTLANQSRVASKAILANESTQDTQATVAVGEIKPLPSATLANQSSVANLSTLIQQEPVTGNWTPWPNEVFDKVMPNLKPQDQSVLARLYRLSRGWRSDTCHVSLPKLSNYCNISEREVHRALARLQQHGLITRIAYDFGNKNKAERGMHFRIHLPEVIIDRQATVATQSRVAKMSRVDRQSSNKEKLLNTSNIKSDSQISADELARLEAEAEANRRELEKVEQQ